MTVPVYSPLWLLDVDGVVNALCTDLPDGYEKTRGTTQGRQFTIRYSPEISDRITYLHASGLLEVRWLTTWGEDALDLAMEIGLPVGCKVEGVEEHRLVHYRWWKGVAAKRLSDADPQRALVWTDDDLDYSYGQGEVAWLDERTGPTLVISPDQREGLTHEHVNRIEAFATKVWVPA